MPWKHRRATYYMALVALTTVTFTVVYNVGMTVWEGRSQPWFRSLEIVFQTFTTTGYGEDAPWDSLQMNLLVIVMQLAGIGLILTAVDVFAKRWLQKILTPTLPSASPDIENHVVVCAYTPRSDAFISELIARDRSYVIIEPDEETATQLHESDYHVINGDPESTTVLEDAGIHRAEALVADAADDSTASIVLSARETNPDVRIVTLVEDRQLAQYHRVAGADEVLSPRQLLGESLARHVPTAVTTSVDEGVTLGEDFELVELTVDRGSDLCDQRFAESRIRSRYGVNVIGAWFDGDFESPVASDRRLGKGTTLLVSGEPDRVNALRDATVSSVRQFSPHEVVIAGFGESGNAAHEVLSETNTRMTVLDTEAKSGVDIVGDARDPDVLRQADIETASAMLVTVGDDTTAIFTTLIAHDLNPDLDIAVRANDQADVEKLYRAGASYVQSLAAVSGRMMASTVFDDEEVLAYDQQIEVVKLPPGDLAGQTLADAAIRSETGCTVVAVERGDEMLTEFDPQTFEFESDDAVVVAGTDESIGKFEAAFDI
ncbi:potassium channel family protein [Halorientalis salina]|uniref:potassium channel family protein n=1 Tax=Halorientalis salina TaxID=2932266 RepID=UPI0010ACA135|nr:NAD-binding protein [Halorientalis salina]